MFGNMLFAIGKQAPLILILLLTVGCSQDQTNSTQSTEENQEPKSKASQMDRFVEWAKLACFDVYTEIRGR